MIETYNNILCIHAGWLIEKGGLSLPNYKKLKRMSRINVIRRASYCTPALIEWDSLPDRFQEKVKSILGYDPKDGRRDWCFSDYLKNDEEALKFFKRCIAKNGKAISQRTVDIYHAKVMVLNAIDMVLKHHDGTRRALGKRDTLLWKNLTEVIRKLDAEIYPHRLPKNYRRLKQKYYDYKSRGYEAILHGGIGNSNRDVLLGEAKTWLLTRWSDPINRVATIRQLFDEYNEVAKEKGWKKLISDRTIKLYLYDEEVQHLWYGARYGERVSKERYTYHIGTRMPSYRDSLWYSDGTKLNLFYLDENGNIATATVYEVMDAYSEVLLGFHVSKTENYEAQYFAYKMAAKVSGHKPYQIAFDNQGGHGKLKSMNFLKKISRLSIKTQPYNGKSKTIESAFGRFQQQFMKRLWNYTGQNITAKRLESKINKEFLLANKDNLPTWDEMILQYKKIREKWNTAPHHRTGIPRIQMYEASVNPETKPISLDDMVDLFWLEREQPVKLSPYGLTFKDKGVKKHYMKYLNDGITPDVDWLKKNIDKKFYIKYDPEDESEIWIYEITPTGKAFSTVLTPKIFVSRGKQEQTEADIKHINAALLANKQHRVATRNKLETIQEAHKATPQQQGFNAPVISGIESSKRKKRRVVTPDYGKSISNKTVIDVDDEIQDIELEAWNMLK